MSFWRWWLLAGVLGVALELVVRRRRIAIDLASYSGIVEPGNAVHVAFWWAGLAISLGVGLLFGPLQVAFVFVRHLVVDPRVEARKSTRERDYEKSLVRMIGCRHKRTDAVELPVPAGLGEPVPAQRCLGCAALRITNRHTGRTAWYPEIAPPPERTGIGRT